MILIISVCSDRFSHSEFVKPIEDILKRANVKFFTKHYTKLDRNELEQAEKSIICGTALKDFKYLENSDQFDWLKEFRKPILGICAGMQLLATVFGSTLVESKRIGQYRVKTVRKSELTSRVEFQSYFLNSKAAEVNDAFEVLSQVGSLPCMIKHKDREHYGCLFHPEVLNQEIIENFAKLQRANQNNRRFS